MVELKRIQSRGKNMQMYTQIKLKLKHKYIEAIEESQMIIMQTVALGPFLLSI